MKRIYKSLIAIFTVALFAGSLTSCEDYLDKEPGTDVSPEVAFKNFRNFQGFVEELYGRIPKKETCAWHTTFNWGEDEILAVNYGDPHLTTRIDAGDFKAYYGGASSYLKWTGASNAGDGRGSEHRIWDNAWYCIRKANLGLENMDMMVDATAEEKDVIKGQLLFFRAWWYEEVIIWWGGMPYLERVPSSSEPLNDPRLTFKETAVKAAADFLAAAELLPNDWDKAAVGAATSGQNQLRITKATAYAYAGKMLLFAASPLSYNGAQVGGAKTYDYDQDLAKQAAEALGKSLALIEDGSSPYALCDYYDANDFEAIFNHDRDAVSGNCFSDIFYTIKQSQKQPGSVEAMLRGSTFGKADDAAWHFATGYICNVQTLAGSELTQTPTANYINYAYGMANGLPIDDPESGFNPEQPFKNRDPRFYHDIVFDGVKYIVKPSTGRSEDLEYASLSTGGMMRNDEVGSRTGYFCQKLVPHQGNLDDNFVRDYSNGLRCYLPYMRVADVYLMYAEAGAAISGASYKATSFSRTAEDAINVLRDRVGAGHVAAKFTADKKVFMDEVRRERACELAYEGFRFNDLQRWLLLTEDPYTVKTAQEFDRVEPTSWYKENDPREAKVKNWREREILKRNFSAKHYWFPIVEEEVYIYEDFSQNPGW